MGSGCLAVEHCFRVSGLEFFLIGFVGVGNFAIGFGFELCLVATKVC